MPGWASSSLTQPAVTREVYFQAFTDSCAIACVAMAIHRVTGSRPTERAIMNAVPDATGRAVRPDGGYVPSAQDRVSTGPDPLTSNADYEGTFARSLEHYLRAYQIPARYLGTDYRDIQGAIWDCTPTRPVIAKVKPAAGGTSHFILIDGFWPTNTNPTRSGQWDLIVCDPQLGIGLGQTEYFRLPQLRVLHPSAQKIWRIYEVVAVNPA